MSLSSMEGVCRAWGESVEHGGSLSSTERILYESDEYFGRHIS